MVLPTHGATSMRCKMDTAIGLPPVSGDAARLVPGLTFVMHACRPASIRVAGSWTRAEPHPREATGWIYSVLVADGERQIELAPATRKFVASAGSSRLADVRARKGLTLFLAPDLLFGADVMAALTPAPAVSDAAGRRVVAFERVVQLEGTDWRQTIHVDERSGLPLRLSLFWPGGEGAPAEFLRTEFRAWELGVRCQPGLFDTTPPEGYASSE